MTDNISIIASVAILGASAVLAAVYGTRYRKRRRAEKLRRRGWKDYNRDRPKLLIDARPHRSVVDRNARP